MSAPVYGFLCTDSGVNESQSVRDAPTACRQLSVKNNPPTSVPLTSFFGIFVQTVSAEVNQRSVQHKVSAQKDKNGRVGLLFPCFFRGTRRLTTQQCSLIAPKLTSAWSRCCQHVHAENTSDTFNIGPAFSETIIEILIDSSRDFRP